jgi:hypothetical protein
VFNYLYKKYKNDILNVNFWKALNIPAPGNRLSGELETACLASGNHFRAAEPLLRFS